MIIHSTTLDTEEKVKAIYGGTTWIQHSGYMLRGATSGVTANNATKTGGEDSVTLTAAQSGVPAHTHSLTSGDIMVYTGAAGNIAVGSGGHTIQGYNIYASNNTAKNASQAHNNISNYKSVYIWERTE